MVLSCLAIAYLYRQLKQPWFKKNIVAGGSAPSEMSLGYPMGQRTQTSCSSAVKDNWVGKCRNMMNLNYSFLCHIFFHETSSCKGLWFYYYVLEIGTGSHFEAAQTGH